MPHAVPRCTDESNASRHGRCMDLSSALVQPRFDNGSGVGIDFSWDSPNGLAFCMPSAWCTPVPIQRNISYDSSRSTRMWSSMCLQYIRASKRLLAERHTDANPKTASCAIPDHDGGIAMTIILPMFPVCSHRSMQSGSPGSPSNTMSCSHMAWISTPASWQSSR